MGRRPPSPLSWQQRRELHSQRRHRAWQWEEFRKTLGLPLSVVTRELDISERSITRYESAEHPPKWYHAALLGLRLSWHDASSELARLPKKGKWGLEPPRFENPFNVKWLDPDDSPIRSRRRTR